MVQQEQPLILVVGGTDTGREPMTVALLRRLLERDGLDWSVASAGVTAHEGEPADPEARNTMLTMGLDISSHLARGLDADLIETAHILLALDSGIAHVLGIQYAAEAAHTHTLAGLAGSQRDIPDPFRMQLGAWFNYAREIETLLEAGLERLKGLVQGQPLASAKADAPAPPPPVAAEQPTPPMVNPADAAEPASGDSEERHTCVERCMRLLQVMEEIPGLVDWPQARQQLAVDIEQIGERPSSANDLVYAYVVLLVTLLQMTDQAPVSARHATLCAAIERLRTPVDPQAVADLAGHLPHWHANP